MISFYEKVKFYDNNPYLYDYFLGLANNCIQALPITFGGLHLIERIDLEQNNLTVLPENLDQLSSCTG